jgi:hypothetical protein
LTLAHHVSLETCKPDMIVLFYSTF